MSDPLVDLLEECRFLGVVITPRPPDRLELSAPEPPPADLLKALHARKAEILQTLREPEGASRFLGLRLAEFEREGSALALRVPWLEGELWFVPVEADATVLTSGGVSRGRIWTVRELADLMSIPGLCLEKVQTIQTWKEGFGGWVSEVRKCRDTSRRQTA